MSRLIPHTDMTAAEIIQCSYDAMAIITLCENTAWDISNRGPNEELAGSISTALKFANTLLGVVHESLEASGMDVTRGTSTVTA